MTDEQYQSLCQRRKTLDELAHLEPVPALWTDKRTRRDSDIPEHVLHGYTPIYDREFSKWRDEPIRLLEIGLNVGASIKMWLQYFTKATIVGMDIADFKFAMPIDEAMLHRFQFVKADQFNADDLRRFTETQQKFDIIVDDGAHASGPIIRSFIHLWSHVKPGGYYVIEDLTEVKNLASHTPDFPNQIEFAQDLIGQIIMGERDIEEAFVSKDLLMLRKKQ